MAQFVVTEDFAVDVEEGRLELHSIGSATLPPDRSPRHRSGSNRHGRDWSQSRSGCGEGFGENTVMRRTESATGEAVVARRVLIVSTVEHADDVLRTHVGEADEVKVVVPVVRQGALDWLANDEKAFGHAERVAERTAAELPGQTVETGAGEANVGLAIRDALATFPADEIVVAVRPRDQEGRVESIATDSAPQRVVEGVPVRLVVIPD